MVRSRRRPPAPDLDRSGGRSTAPVAHSALCVSKAPTVSDVVEEVHGLDVRLGGEQGELLAQLVRQGQGHGRPVRVDSLVPSVDELHVLGGQDNVCFVSPALERHLRSVPQLKRDAVHDAQRPFEGQLAHEEDVAAHHPSRHGTGESACKC